MNSPDSESAEGWRATLEAGGVGDDFARIEVLAETDSTMDAARGLPPGSLMIALRQRRGRGRLGRVWVDGGIAFTVVIAAPEPCDGERLAIAAALGAAGALEATLAGGGLADRVGVKWPNDLMLRDRKLGGILVERVDGVALVGVGVDYRVPASGVDADRAIDLASTLAEGTLPPRGELVGRLARQVATACRLRLDEVEQRFAARDWLRGRRARFLAGGVRLEGKVRSIDPFTAIELEIEASGDSPTIERIDPRTATVEWFESGPSRG